jgi:hypothetical protein
MKRKSLNRKNSGQFLIITSLVIALLLLSVVYYTLEVERKSGMQTPTPLNSYVLAIKLGSRNTVTSALVNVSNGGENEILTANLNEFSSIIGNQSHFGKCNLRFTPLNSSPYQSGIWISWGSNGLGVSSAYADFSLDIVGIQANAQLEYYVNTTTTLKVEGVYSELNGTTKQVNVTCRVFNEGEPALANSFVVHYDNGSNWIQPQHYNQIDYGNGTYRLTFNANITVSTVQVSVGAYDWRGIYVQANATCTET